MFEFLIVAAVVVVVLAVLGASFFEAGRASYRREILRSWQAARCRECGAQPEPRVRHATGCESGWPDPGDVYGPLQ